LSGAGRCYRDYLVFFYLGSTPQPVTPCGTSRRGCSTLPSPARRGVFEPAAELGAAPSSGGLQSATRSFQGAVAALRFAPTVQKYWKSSPQKPCGKNGDASHAAGLQRVPTGAAFNREFAVTLGETVHPPGALGRSRIISKAAETTLPASVQRIEGPGHEEITGSRPWRAEDAQGGAGAWGYRPASPAGRLCAALAVRGRPGRVQDASHDVQGCCRPGGGGGFDLAVARVCDPGGVS